ncbi:MAG: GT4 family glycosyltransferase PelF [Myxococcaceae bacterium]
MSKAEEVADVCLVLEGTYPYTRGGVSSWVHSIIQGLPDITFSLLLISSTRHQKNEVKYELPPNLVSFAEIFIHETVTDAAPRRSAAEERKAWEAVGNFHTHRGRERHQHAAALLRAFADKEHRSLSVMDVLFSRKAWELALSFYKERAAGTSFIDYFWTFRAVHAPLMQTLLGEVPKARIYHAVSTGYAGLLGVLGKMRFKRPLILTEHGIYVRERAIDIARADWIYEEPVRVKLVRPGANPLKEMWINFFVTLGELTYDASDEIITLFGGNAEIQHQLGADPRRTKVIPNGVDTEVYAPLRTRRAPEGSRPLRVGFIGRVVPIKDVKTLVKACALVARQLPEVEFWIVGPYDEDLPYYEECRELAESAGLKKLRFTGPQDVKKVYPEIDVMVLTSVSEGQPLTILEAGCAAVPSVATDVGACRELLEGRTAEDKALGPGGLVTGVGAPEQTAAALVRILSDPELRRKMSAAAAARTEQFYKQSMVIERYRAIYQKHLE